MYTQYKWVYVGHTVLPAPGCCCKSAPHFHRLAWSHLGYYYQHGTRQWSAHLLYSWEERSLIEKGEGRRERGEVRCCSRTVVLMYSCGPASVIKQHFPAFSSICCLSPCFINDKHGLQHKQMSAALTNQDLLDLFCCCFAFACNFTWMEAGIILWQRRKICVSCFFPTGSRVDVFAMHGECDIKRVCGNVRPQSNACALSCVFEVNSSSR